MTVRWSPARARIRAIGWRCGCNAACGAAVDVPLVVCWPLNCCGDVDDVVSGCRRRRNVDVQARCVADANDKVNVSSGAAAVSLMQISDDNVTRMWRACATAAKCREFGRGRATKRNAHFMRQLLDVIRNSAVRALHCIVHNTMLPVVFKWCSDDAAGVVLLEFTECLRVCS